MDRKKGRITVQSQPTKETRAMERLASIPFLLISGFFVIIGVTEIIPTFGLFGIVWTLVAVSFMVIGVVNLVRKNGMAHRVAYDVDPAEEDETVIQHIFTDEPLESEGFAPTRGDIESRLQELRNLYDRSLITEEEYETKKQEILKEL